MATKTTKVNTETEVKATKKAAKTTAEKKTATKATAAKKATTEKKATTKTVAKSTNKNQIFVQFLGFQFSHDEMLEKVKADYTAKTGKKRVTSTELYVKPEDMKIYYVVNGSFASDVELN